ncbi:unnamed protein product, partial [Tilletia caries]
MVRSIETGDHHHTTIHELNKEIAAKRCKNSSKQFTALVIFDFSSKNPFYF